jgi:hypothetical protein
MRASHLYFASKTISIPLKINLSVRLEILLQPDDILDASRKFYRKILGCAELFIECHSIPLRSDHDHDLVALFGTLGFECGCLLFPADVDLYDPSCNINRGSSGNGLPRISGI